MRFKTKKEWKSYVIKKYNLTDVPVVEWMANNLLVPVSGAKKEWELDKGVLSMYSFKTETLNRIKTQLNKIESEESDD